MRVRRVLFIAACLMLSQVALSLVRPMTSYRLLELSQPAAMVGWVSAVYALAPLFLALPLGRFTGSRAMGRLAVIGSVLLVLGCVILGLGVEVWQLVIGSVVLGTGNLGQMIAYQSLIAMESAENEFDKNYGWFSAGASVGQLVGPVLGTVAFEGLGSGLAATQFAILVGATASLVGLALTIVLVRKVPSDRVARAPDIDDLPRGLAFRTLRRPGAKASIYVSLVGLSSLDLLQVYLPVLGEARGISPTTVGALLAARATSSLVARVFLGWLVAHYVRRTILLITVGSAAVMMCLVPAFTDPLVLFVLMALIGLGLGTGQPISLAWSVSVVAPSERATAIALRLMGNRLGQVVIPGVASVFVAVAGTASVFLLIGAMLASSTGAVAATGDRR